MKFILAATALISVFPAFGATLTFDGPAEVLAGTVSEGIFSYTVIEGGLYRSDVPGSSTPYLEGGFSPNSLGVLQILRNDVPNGLFLFQSADVAAFNFDGESVLVEGYLAGSQIASDSLTTLPGDNNWVTGNAVNLAGVFVDELRISLLTGATTSNFQELDNVVLSVNAVPEPESIVLFLGGLTVIGYLRNRGVWRATRCRD